jgi:hypothetical protein
MSIPLPMIWSARIAFPKKLGLCVMFCGGLITAVFGGLRCGYVLGDGKNGPQLAGEWSCRESFVAIFITNFPILFPILHRALRRANTKFSSYGPSSSKDKTPGGGDTKSSSGFKLSTVSKKDQKRNKYKHPLSLPAETFYERFGSEEDIITMPEGMGGVPGSKGVARRFRRRILGSRPSGMCRAKRPRLRQ